MARSAPIHAGLVFLQGSQTCFSNTVHTIHNNLSFCLYMSIHQRQTVSLSPLIALHHGYEKKKITYFCFTKTKTRQFTECLKFSLNPCFLCVVSAALVNSRLWVMEGQVFQRVMQRSSLITITQSLHFLRRLVPR